MRPDFTGYHDCPCRDCFEISIGGALHADGSENKRKPALCHACEEAGCDPTGESECSAPHAYGCDDEHATA